jgi:hypothetical protein
MTLNRPTPRRSASHRPIDPIDPIDQRTAHQLVVSQILGAIICDPALRILRTDDRSRPYVTMTDMLADLRGAADLAVSFDGSFKYGLLIEVKTIATWTGAYDLNLFNHVTDEKYYEGRNKAQLERLVNVAPSWWYVIVDTAQLKGKNHSEHARAILECPAVFVEGRHADTRSTNGRGFKALGDLLNELHDHIAKLNISKVKSLPTPCYQMDLLPMDDVPVVTMDEPLRMPTLAPVAPAPQPAPQPAPVPVPVPAPIAEVERALPNEHVIPMFEAVQREMTLLGGIEAVLDKFPAEVVNEFNTLITLSGEQRISVCSLRPQRLFVRSQLHLTTTGALVLAWRQASFKRSANGQLQRLTMRSLPTLHYRVGSVKQKLHIISALAKNIS